MAAPQDNRTDDCASPNHFHRYAHRYATKFRAEIQREESREWTVFSKEAARSFALDIWTMMQQDYPSADQESSACSGSLVLMSLDAPCEPVRPRTPGASTGGRA